MKRFWVRVILVFLLTVSSCQPPAPIVQPSPLPPLDPSTLPQANLEPLVLLAQPGPWSGIAHFVGYGDRLWFVNSQTFADFNTADVYSYDPRTGTNRYETHLFSQDAGIPTVANGLLYWPFEDPRSNSERGEYWVTNGKTSQWRYIPEGEAFHTHVMASVPFSEPVANPSDLSREQNGKGSQDFSANSRTDSLFVGTGAWQGRLQRSQDGGNTWQLLYTHPTPSGNVSRITDLIVLGDQVYVGVTALREAGAKLYLGQHHSWQNNTESLRSVPGWPGGQKVESLVSYRGWVYALNQDSEQQISLWRTDGKRSEPVAVPGGYRLRALAADTDFLWLVGADQTQGGGRLWRWQEEQGWQEVQKFSEQRPIAVTSYGGNVYVGTWGRDRGSLWGVATPAALEPPLDPVPLPPWSSTLEPPQVAAAVTTMNRALQDPNTYRQKARLIEALQPLARSGLPQAGAALSQRLREPFPDVPGDAFNQQYFESAQVLGPWFLLWAIALNGHGSIPLTLLQQPWTESPNRVEKYWNPGPAAVWAVAQIGQKDPETLAVLVDRLSRQEDPLWLKGDVVGTLTQLTGQQFGYDFAAWRTWLDSKESGQ